MEEREGITDSRKTCWYCNCISIEAFGVDCLEKSEITCDPCGSHCQNMPTNNVLSLVPFTCNSPDFP